MDPFSPEGIIVSLVHMAMQHISRPVLQKEIMKACKTSVGEVIQIPHSSGRRVGNNKIHTAGFLNLAPELSDSPAHLLFRIHTAAFPVAETSPQAGNPDTAIHKYLPIYSRTSFRWS